MKTKDGIKFKIIHDQSEKTKVVVSIIVEKKVFLINDSLWRGRFSI